LQVIVSIADVQSLGCMNESIVTEVELDLPPDEAWEHIIDPAWLGDNGHICAVPGGEGEVLDDGLLHVVVVEEVERPDRFAFRWATFDEPPSRVEIDIIESDGGSRVVITETPLMPIALQRSSTGSHEDGGHEDDGREDCDQHQGNADHYGSSCGTVIDGRSRFIAGASWLHDVGGAGHHVIGIAA
jgi:uncharacterized protein YndB with AHSA1/START domain